MKLAILGGAGVRTPLFVQGIIRISEELGIDRVCLMDIDTHRLNLIGFVARQLVSRAGNPVALECTDDAREAISGSDFVVSAIRVGGLEGRVTDETVALRYGVIGQETTGPGGICMGMRTIPVMLQYARIMKELCPNAWLINFTNPSGMITQAIKSSGITHRVVGVCDGPSAMFHRVATAIGVDEGRAYFDYFGLNHLGWLRGIYTDGEEALQGAILTLTSSASADAACASEQTDMDGGYERIALGVIRAIRMNLHEVMVLNTCNLGAIEGIAHDAVVETPCLVDTNGLHPLAVGSVPCGCLGLMQQVKECEMLACEAAVTGSYSAAWKALALHPLVPSAAVARSILDDCLDEHGALLAHIRR